MELNEVQFQIIDALYFVEPYQTLLDEVRAAQPVVAAELKTLIDRGLVHVYAFDDRVQDFVRTSLYDVDNLHGYRYLATKAGLLAHHGRGPKAAPQP